MSTSQQVAISNDQYLLVHKFCETRDSGLRSDLISLNLPLVESLAKRFLFKSHGEPLEDLVQVGTIGLIKAVDRYDPKREAQFNTFATHQILGEIRHYLRDKVDLIRHPRWLRYLNFQVYRQAENLAQEFGRFPTPKEIADAMNIDHEGVIELLKLNEMLMHTSFDEDGSRHFLSVRSKIRAQRLLSFQLPIEDKISVITALQRLVEIERKAIYLFFYYDLTQTEIGTQLGLSQRTVSRVIEKGLTKLKGLMSTELW